MKIYENLDLQNLDEEIWKDIEGYEGLYQVSNYGRIKSFIKYRGTNERILKQNEIRKYLSLKLYKNKKYKTKYIHRLVYEAHIGKLEEGYDAHHINENKKDNFVNNLESKPHPIHIGEHHKGKIVSEETKMKIIRNHVDFKGEKHPNFKITNQIFISILTDIEKGDLTQRQIAKKYNISYSTVSKIKTGKIRKG